MVRSHARGGAVVVSALRFVATNTLIVRDIKRSVTFYRDVLGATVLGEGEPALLRLANIWLTINSGGAGTDDKPEVIASPPRDPDLLSMFLNLRVIDIRRCYELWSSRGATFITEPKVHATEIRCYMRDPDGYLIEVGQTTSSADPLGLFDDRPPAVSEIGQPPQRDPDITASASSE